MRDKNKHYRNRRENRKVEDAPMHTRSEWIITFTQTRKKCEEDCGVITQRVVAISYRRFGTNYRSHLQGSRISCTSRWKPEVTQGRNAVYLRAVVSARDLSDYNAGIWKCTVQFPVRYTHWPVLFRSILTKFYAYIRRNE